MIPKRIIINNQTVIPLGMQGDGNVREIAFSVPADLAAKTWTASHQRATDPEPYPVAVRAEENMLIWRVSSADTNVSGQGRFQLTCLDEDNQTLKTIVFRTCVIASLPAPGEVPDPVKPWFDEIMREFADLNEISPEEIERAVQDYMTEHPIEETDPTVPEWAKQPEKPEYTASEIGALSEDALPDAINQALTKAKQSGEFNGAPGKDGTSVTVQTVSESTEDGGGNVVTFSDGKQLTVKNGKTGAKGDPGEDYTLTEADKQEIAEMTVELVPSGGGSGDISLGISGAEVGQIVKVTAVDEDGKPTAWEPADMFSEGSETWELISTVEVTESVSSIVISTDLSGAQFELKKLAMYAPKNVTVSETGQLRVILYQGVSGQMNFTSVNSTLNSSSAVSVWVEFEPFGNFWRELLAANTYDVTNVMININGIRLASSTGQPVNKVEIKTQYGSFTAGTFYVYGVRA